MNSAAQPSILVDDSDAYYTLFLLTQESGMYCRPYSQLLYAYKAALHATRNANYNDLDVKACMRYWFGLLDSDYYYSIDFVPSSLLAEPSSCYQR